MDLIDAIVAEDIEAFRALIAGGADVNARADASAMTPLHLAAFEANEEMINVLLDNGADINAMDNQGHTPLHLSIIHHAGEEGAPTLDIVNLLASRGADLDLQDHDGRTALFLATSESGYECVDVLLAAGADPLIADRNGRKPSDVAGETWARDEEKTREMAQVLIAAERRLGLQWISARTQSAAVEDGHDAAIGRQQRAQQAMSGQLPEGGQTQAQEQRRKYGRAM